MYIELSGEAPTPASLEVLGEGRRLATALGAALYALLPVPSRSAGAPADMLDDHQWVSTLGRAGADKVVMVSPPGAGGPGLWSTRGRLLDEVVTRIRPALVLLAATHTGRDIAPRLAARMNAAYVAEPSIERTPDDRIVLSRRLCNGALVRSLSLSDLEGAAVVTLAPGRCEPARGYDEAEALCLDAPGGDATGIEYLGDAGDPGGALDGARVIVVAGGGVPSAEAYQLLGDLARALSGELAATQTLCDRGIAPPERAIGLGLRHVAPRLYVACAASGSAAHLAAVSPGAGIVAINSDPGAPIFAVANYGIIGDIHTVVPALIAALDQRGQPVTEAT